jgi:hypothetical protein
MNLCLGRADPLDKVKNEQRSHSPSEDRQTLTHGSTGKCEYMLVTETCHSA